MKRVSFWASLLLALAACHRPPNESAKPAVAEPTAKASEPAEPVARREAPPPEPRVEELLVPGDLVASVVRGADGKPPVTVFMGGVCSNTNAYLQTFPHAAQKTGGVVGIEGDQLCGPGVDPHFRTYSWDAGRQHARIEAALAAAGLTEIPKEGLTLVGYSQGASLAEQLAARYPGRYARIVIIAAPTDPAPRDFAKTRALVTMACSRDVTVRMKTAATATNKLGTPATYFQMPDCTHGQVADAENIFGQSFDWLAANERPVPDNVAPTRIAGPRGPIL
jgi:pimeloyl-ACP methyl ester carboxylesterase